MPKCHPTVAENTSLRYNSAIHARLTAKTFERLDSIRTRYNLNRNEYIRAVIVLDLQTANASPLGMAERSLWVYRQRIGKRLRGEQAIRIRVSRDFRALVRARCDGCGFTVAEYVVALIERAAHHEGIR